MSLLAEIAPAPETVAALRGVRRRRAARAVVVTTALAGLAFGLFVLTMMVGSYRLPASDVLRSVLRLGADPAIDFIVLDLRLPIAVSALSVGLALGVSGSVFQQVLRNPLAAPDIVGVSAGASLAAVTSIVVLQASGLFICLAALVGAVIGAATIYLLAWRNGVSGYRFILIGIGVAAVFESGVGYLLTRATLWDAREAMHWLTGTVGRAGDREQYALAVALAVLVPVAYLLQRPLRALDLGDDTARGLGISTELARFALLGVSVLLVAAATAVAGPIAFVALVAGPIANRLLGPATGGLLAAGLVGASALLAADLIAVHLLPVSLPTGVVTGALGAPYLLWLIASTNREGAGG